MAGVSWGILNDAKSNRNAATDTLSSFATNALSDYQNQYSPLQTQIARVAAGSNAGSIVNDMQAAAAAAGNDAGRSEAEYRRQLRAAGGLGESESAVRRFGLRRVLESVNAANLTSRSARAQQEAAQQYGLSATANNLGDVGGILSSLAGSEADRYAQYTNAKAQAGAAKDAATGSLIGTGLSIAAMFI